MITPRVILELPPHYDFDQEDFLDFETIRARKTEYTPNQKAILKSLYSIIAKAKKYPSFTSSSISKPTKNVVIKNIGNMKASHLKNALLYTLRNSDEKMAFNEDFQRVTLDEILKDWSLDFDEDRDLNEAMHLVFSLKEEQDEYINHALLMSTFETMKQKFLEYKFAMIPHTHQNHPHIHIILNKTNQFNGKKLHFSSKKECKDFFFVLREEFKNNLGRYDERFKHQYINHNNLSILNHLINQAQQNIPQESVETTLLLIEKVAQNLNALYGRMHSKSLPSLENKKAKIAKEHERVMGFKDEFLLYCKNISSLEQKKIVFEKIDKIDKRFLNKECIALFKNLKSEIEMESKNLSVPLLEKYDIPINEKSNTRTLKKAFFRLRKIDFLLPHTETTEETKTKIKSLIKDHQEEIVEMIRNRLEFVSECFEENRKKRKKLFEDFSQTKDPKEMENLLKKIERVEKNLRFNALEILSARKFVSNKRIEKETLNEAILELNRKQEITPQKIQSVEKGLDRGKKDVKQGRNKPKSMTQ